MSRYAKFISAALAFLGVLVSQGVLEGKAQDWVTALVAALGAAAVYVVPNTPPAGQPSDPSISEVG